MKHIGHPIFNDIRYGGDKILKGTVFNKYKQFVDNCFKLLPRQALHAKTIGFIHPTTKKKWSLILIFQQILLVLKNGKTIQIKYDFF